MARKLGSDVQAGFLGAATLVGILAEVEPESHEGRALPLVGDLATEQVGFHPTSTESAGILTHS
jgi:hypothetical protein